MKNPSHPIILFALLFFSNSTLFSQDTLSVKLHKDTTTEYIKPLLAEAKYQYINPNNPDTITRNTLLWYPLKNTEDVFNYLPGYYLKYMDVGQVQNLSYNQSDFYNIAVLRHGRPINDLLDGTIDFNLFSRNEIEEMELTNGFGNFLYNYGNGVNIIERQIFRNRPFSEISYWQDRFENLYFDGSYHQNIFKKFNFNFGITKHSYDGKYTNSDFDKWLGRFKLNFIGSKKFNSFLSVNYSKIQRGLNEGINIDSVKSLDKETLFDAGKAFVKNPDAYEIRERFDIDFGGLFVFGKNNDITTRFQLFESNSFRKYRDEDIRTGHNGIYVKDNSRWIDYGAKIQQTFNLKLSKFFNVTSRTEAEYDKDLIHTNLSTLSESERMFLKEDVELALKNISVQAYAKTFKLKYIEDKFYTDFGLSGGIQIPISNSSIVKLNGSYTRSNHLPAYQTIFLNGLNIRIGTGVYAVYYPILEKNNQLELSASFSHKYGWMTAQYYERNKIYRYREFAGDFSRCFRGINIKSLLRISVIELEGEYEHYFIPYTVLPVNSGNLLLTYHDLLFKKKFEVKIGVNTRFWSDYTAEFYNGLYNRFLPFYQAPWEGSHKILANASLDFFIIGKINKATFGLTLENILNRLYYTAGLYPNQNRGGLGNTISRFNITWYFLN